VKEGARIIARIDNDRYPRTGAGIDAFAALTR